MTDNIFYGIWIPTVGWLRGAESRALMFDSKIVALQTASRIDNHAQVFYIDQSLVDIEQQLLEAEAKRNQLPLFKRIFQTLKVG